jgi:hypothetical protein
MGSITSIVIRPEKKGATKHLHAAHIHAQVSKEIISFDLKRKRSVT